MANRKNFIRLMTFALLFLVSLVIIDYLMMQSIDSLLDEQPDSFQTVVEADLCNALTNYSYFGPRFFIKQTLERRQVNVEFLQGRCRKGQLTRLSITHKLPQRE